MRTTISRGFGLTILPGVLLLGACGGAAANAGDAGDARDVSMNRDSHDVGSTDGAGDTSRDGDADSPVPHGYMLPEFPGGNTFYVRLPPSFSPFLPLSGDEATREPPGFYDTSSPTYFSYGFIWWLTGTPDLSTAALQNDLNDYYVGVCQNAMVAVTLGDPVTDLPPAAEPSALVARRNGTLTAGTCFGNPVAPATIDVSTYSCPDHVAVIVLVSAQPAASQVWTDLRGIRDGFSCW